MNYLQVHINATKNNVEKCETLLLSLGAASVMLDDAQDQALLEPLPGETPLWDLVVVTGIFPQDDDAPHDSDALMAFLQLQLPDHEIWSDVLADQAWERAWMDYYEPIQVSERLWIVPQWLDAPDPAAVNIRLDPGLAFGTGNHASTYLCLQWLARQDLHGKTVIDYGCGSGILAVAALLLGAKQVYATDIDPQAVLATRQNAELNGVADRLMVDLPDQFDACYSQLAPADRASVLVANILAKPLMSLAPTFHELTTAHAAIALAGLIEEQVEDVRQSYTPYFDLTECAMRDGNWCRLSGHRV